MRFRRRRMRRKRRREITIILLLPIITSMPKATSITNNMVKKYE